MASEHNHGTGGARVLASDVASMVREHAACTLRWYADWQGGYYGGRDKREYPATLGAREIMRQIKCERSDRKGTGAYIYREAITCMADNC